MDSLRNLELETLNLKPRLRAVLFDWDGTLADSAEASLRCYARLFASFGIAFDRERFGQTYSPDWYRTYEAVALPRERWSEADARWVELYEEEQPRLLPGAKEALARLRAGGLSTALVTSGNRSRVERELARLKLSGEFDALVCSEDVHRKKPDPESLRLALERLQLTPPQVAFVGDSPEDVAMSRAAAVYVVGVEGAFPNRDALRASRPDLLARDLAHAAEALIARAIPMGLKL